jgi:hypothetical protein
MIRSVQRSEIQIEVSAFISAVQFKQNDWSAVRVPNAPQSLPGKLSPLN